MSLTSREDSTEALASAPCSLLASILSKTLPFWSSLGPGFVSLWEKKVAKWLESSMLVLQTILLWC